MYSSFMAGVVISIGAIMNLKAKDPVVGAMLFSLGLFSVIAFGFDLYTGKVSRKDWAFKPAKLMLCLFFNLLGCEFMSFLSIGLYKEGLRDAARLAIEAKYLRDPGAILVSSILCGMLISIAVKSNNEIMILFSVMTFILTGAEHCIADAYLMFTAMDVKVPFLVLVAFGNWLGGAIFIPIRRSTDGSGSSGSDSR